MTEPFQRKIIHIDMDCFYAAIEIRDDPSLANQPVAVGGAPNDRGVLCTCNYIARQYGVRSAMPTAQAYRLCPDLIVLPVNMMKYRETAKLIHEIFHEVTDLVEPLSLDEAFIDVSQSNHYQGSATLIAQDIRRKIWDKVNLTASAGVAPNKFLAKIASGWKKPNGLFVIPPKDVQDFIKDLPVKSLFGVGKVTAEKLHQSGLILCSDLQKMSPAKLIQLFGKFGQQLYDQSHGIDNRPVEPNRIRKSLSVEQTFTKNIHSLNECIDNIDTLYQQLIKRIRENAPDRKIKNQYLKIKFSDFKQKTIEKMSDKPDLTQYKNLLHEIHLTEKPSIRLLGLGVHFQSPYGVEIKAQQSLL